MAANFAPTSTRILLRFASTHSSAVASRLRSREVLIPASLHNVGDLAAWIRGRYRVVEDADVRLQWKGRPLASTRTLASVVGRRGAAAQPPLLEVLCAAPAPPTAAPTAAGRPSKKRPRDATAETAPEPTPRSRRRSAESLDSVASADVGASVLADVPDERVRRRGRAAPLPAPAAGPQAPPRAVLGAARVRLAPRRGRVAGRGGRGRLRRARGDVRPPAHLRPVARGAPGPGRPPARLLRLGALVAAAAAADAAVVVACDGDLGVVAEPVAQRGLRRPGQDVALVVVAGADLEPPGGGVAVARGHRYPTVMRDVDTFGNLRRHYAKHNALRETELALFHGGAKLPLLACARDRGLARRRGDRGPPPGRRAERCAPRRISSTSSDEGARGIIARAPTAAGRARRRAARGRVPGAASLAAD
ncbi:hypothetical protein JL721_9646 [Aureococcus anophagefferens]|nr:hypothetical protein JL721_9646 [Aureococcus anophagefferens]